MIPIGFEKMMLEAGIKNIVEQTIQNQFRVQMVDAVSPLPIKDYKKIRRGVRWVMTSAGFPGHISDEKLIEILEGLHVKLSFKKEKLKNYSTYK